MLLYSEQLCSELSLAGKMMMLACFKLQPKEASALGGPALDRPSTTFIASARALQSFFLNSPYNLCYHQVNSLHVSNRIFISIKECCSFAPHKLSAFQQSIYFDFASCSLSLDI